MISHPNARVLQRWWGVQDSNGAAQAKTTSFELLGIERGAMVGRAGFERGRPGQDHLSFKLLGLERGSYGGACRIRTCDHLIKSQMLYQLS